MGDTNLEILMQKLINGETIEGYEARSRLEEHLLACINGTGADDLGTPRSVAEALLQVLAEQIQNGEMPGSAANGLPLEVDELPSGKNAVPVSGMVETISFNTSMSTEEVVNFIDKITENAGWTTEHTTWHHKTIYVFLSSDFKNAISYVKDSKGHNNAEQGNITYRIQCMVNGKSVDVFDSTNGWYGVNSLTVNAENIIGSHGIIQLQNDMVKDLIYIQDNNIVDGAIYKKGSSPVIYVYIDENVGPLPMNEDNAYTQEFGMKMFLEVVDHEPNVGEMLPADMINRIMHIYYDINTNKPYMTFDGNNIEEIPSEQFVVVNSVDEITTIGETFYAILGDGVEYHLSENGSFTQLIPEDEIEPGVTPEGTLEISENDVYNINTYAEADVNVSVLEPVIDEENNLFSLNGAEVVGNTLVLPYGTAAVEENVLIINPENNEEYNTSGVLNSNGIFEIRENGLYDVRDYVATDIDIKSLDTNVDLENSLLLFDGAEVVGNTLVLPYGTAAVEDNVLIIGEDIVVGGGTTPIGVLDIAENGIYDVTGFAEANVNVPIPEGYIIPEGTLEITANGEHSVTEKDKVNVNVPIPEGYIIPEGILEITENGSHDVTLYSNVEVNVSGGSGGSGTDMLQARVDSNNSCDYLFYFYYGDNVDYISGLDTSKVTSMNSMFIYCENLTTIPQLDTSKVTSMNSMFYNCTSLTTIPQLDTRNVTDMSNMFYNCTSLTTIPQLDTSNVTNMRYMFRKCEALTEIPQLDTSKVTDMTDMFYDCENLKIINSLDFSSLTGDIYDVLGYNLPTSVTTIRKINVNNNNITSLSSMFMSCTSLTEIDEILNTSSITNMNSMFNGCTSLTTIPQLDTSNVTNMSSMFSTCYKLTNIDITYYNISSTSNIDRFVAYCYALKSLIIREFGDKYVLNSNSFTSSSIANGTGYIYVPRSMVDTLKSATNWSTYASQIRALEDYTVDGTTTGALDESKI